MTLADRVARATGSAVETLAELDGGAVGTVHRADLADGRTVVAKTGETPLTVEAAMLRYLGSETELPVPAVHHADDDLLVLSYVPGDGAVTPAVERDLADHLAALHDHTAERFGFHFDTLSGVLRQPNPWTGSWVEFFREFRLRRVADRARETGRLPAATHERVAALCGDLDALLAEPTEPSLVHGDAWTGNLVVDGDRVAAVLDPALYYGHPAVEVAYVAWTGTGGDPFLERYREQRGLAPGFEDRRPVYELLALLEHVHHFGDEYLADLRVALDGLGY